MSPDELDLNKIAAEVVDKQIERFLKAIGPKLTFHDYKSAKKYTQNIVERYGSMRILGMKAPIPLNDVYIKVNLLEKPSAYLGLSPNELELWDNYYKEYRWISQKRVDALEVVKKYRRLILLGQPGAGKITFLKYLVLQAVKGKMKPKRLPIFISLKDWMESEHEYLLDFMAYEFDICGFPKARPFIEKMLEQGKCLLLLDGLDEASGSSRFIWMQTQIRDFTDKHSNNQFIISCRVAAYNQYLSHFSDAEIADFDKHQSTNFIRRWFGENNSKAEQCLKELEQPQNIPILELTHNPLLLTLLCLAYDCTQSFPSRRAELYKDALEALLREWDSSRNIRRQEIYQQLTTGRKEDLFSYLAWPWFKVNRYFVHQQEAEEGIAAFIRNLPETKGKNLVEDTIGVLRAIEAHHGILVQRAHQVYSFAHLSFQEYYCARYLKENPEGLNLLLEHLAEKRWREVFLLASELFSKADNLIQRMQTQANSLIDKNPKINQLLAWAQDKTTATEASCHPAALRASYLDIYLANIRALAVTRDLDLIHARTRILKYGLYFTSILSHGFDLGPDVDLDLTLARILDIALGRGRILSRDFNLALEFAQKMKLNSLVQSLEELVQIALKDATWEEESVFAEKLREVMIRERNIGHRFELDEAQISCLYDYLYTNQLIVDCLHGGCYVTREIREEILNTLLIPPNL